MRIVQLIQEHLDACFFYFLFWCFLVPLAVCLCAGDTSFFFGFPKDPGSPRYMFPSFPFWCSLVPLFVSLYAEITAGYPLHGCWVESKRRCWAIHAQAYARTHSRPITNAPRAHASLPAKRTPPSQIMTGYPLHEQLGKAPAEVMGYFTHENVRRAHGMLLLNMPDPRCVYVCVCVSVSLSLESMEMVFDSMEMVFGVYGNDLYNVLKTKRLTTCVWACGRVRVLACNYACARVLACLFMSVW